MTEVLTYICDGAPGEEMTRGRATPGSLIVALSKKGLGTVDGCQSQMLVTNERNVRADHIVSRGRINRVKTQGREQIPGTHLTTVFVLRGLFSTHNTGHGEHITHSK